MKAYEG